MSVLEMDEKKLNQKRRNEARPETIELPDDWREHPPFDCWRCGGTGYVVRGRDKEVCPNCGGWGQLWEK
jgi:rubrerythrin